MIQMCDIKISLDGIIRRKKSKKPPLGRQGCKKWVRSTDVQTFTKDYTGLNEATAYTIVFDASNVGAGAITISFNNTVETVELGDLELND